MVSKNCIGFVRKGEYDSFIIQDELPPGVAGRGRAWQGKAGQGKARQPLKEGNYENDYKKGNVEGYQTVNVRPICGGQQHGASAGTEDVLRHRKKRLSNAFG